MRIFAKAFYLIGFLVWTNQAMAAPPTTPAFDIVFTGFNTTTLDLSWTNGNGARRIVVAKQGGDPDANPVNNSGSYVANAAFGSGTQLGTGNFIVFNGTGNTVSVTGLSPNIVYHFKVFEYNGTGFADAEYLTSNGTDNPNSRSTLASVPSNQPTSLLFSNPLNDGTGYTLTWTASAGGADGYIVVRRQGASPNGPAPADGTGYIVGQDIDPGADVEIVEFVGAATTFNLSGLLANTNYFFDVYAFNGSGAAVNYLTGTGPLEGNRQTLQLEPSTQATNISFNTLNTTSYTITWMIGNGANRIVVIDDAAIAFTPSEATNYTTNVNYTAGTDLGGGQKCVFNGNGNSVSVTNLTPNTVYHVRVFEYNGSGESQNYNTTTSTDNPSSRTTLASQPASAASSIQFSNITQTSFDLNFTNGDGSSRLVVLKQGSAVDSNPVDGSVYTANATFGNGSQLGTGNYVVGIGSGPFSISGLTGDVTYHVAVYEFNGTGGAENYRITGAPTASRQTSPTLQATDIVFSNLNTTTYTVSWTNAVDGSGGGSRRLVLAHLGAPVDANPAELTSYTPNAAFGSGTQIGTGNFVVFDGTGSSVNMTGLIANNVYHFRVYEYNGANTSSASYNTATATDNPNSRTTLESEPTTSSTSIVFSATSQTQTTLTWMSGNGARRVVVAKAGSAVDSNPVDGTGYSANNVFGTGTQLGTGNFVVYDGTGNSETVTGLSSGTTYHFRIYDYNGTGATSNYRTTTGSNNPNNVTTLVAVTSLLTAGASAEPATVSSLIDTQGEAVLNLDFSIQDDGASPGSDASKLLFSAITINRKDLVSGDVDNWADAIDGAELSSEGDIVTATSITANTIVFSGIANGNEDLGEIDDNETKVYTLKIWLKAALGGTLPDDIDGKGFVFRISETDLTLAPGSSGFVPAQTIESGDGNNKVDVDATKIIFNTQPSTSAIATVVLPQQPVMEATDVNNVRDIDFTSAISSVNTTNPTNLGPVFSPTSFAGGVATFTDLRFNNTGTSTMSVTSNAIVSDNSSSITVTAVTTLATQTNTVNPGPNLTNSSLNQVVLGFSLSTSGSVLNFTDLTVTSSADPDTRLSGFELWRSVDTDFTTGGDNTLVTSAFTTPGNAIDFASFTSSLSGTPVHFFIVADVNPFFDVATPSIQLSVSSANVTVSTGSVTGGPITGVNYNLIDNTAPTVTSITNQVNPIFEGSLTQTVVVVFSEPMKTVGFNPVLSISGSNWGPQSAGNWTTTTNTNDTYTATFVHNGTQELIAAAVSAITSNVPQDLNNNAVTGTFPTNSIPFVVDTQKPTVSSITTSSGSVLGVTTNFNTLTVTVTYSEPMDKTSFPTITFSPVNANFSAPAPSAANWNVPGTIYTIVYTHNLTAQTVASTTVSANGGRDVATNTQTVAGTSAAFLTDTQRPFVSSVNRLTPAVATPVSSTTVIFRVTFNEAVSNVDASDFVTETLSGALTFGVAPVITVNPVSSTVYDVSVGNPIAGDGTFRLNVPAAATIVDARNNAYNTLFNAGQQYNIDNTAPVLSGSPFLPLDNQLAVPFNASGWQLTLADLNGALAKGTGNIVINQVSPATSFPIDVNSAAVSITGLVVTINPTVAGVFLAPGLDYYITIPSGVILDQAGNAFAGISSTTQWNFSAYGAATITNIIKSPSATTLAACVGEIITIQGRNFTGYGAGNFEAVTTVRFTETGSATDFDVTAAASITVTSDTELTVVVPNNVALNESVRISLVKAQEVTPIGTNLLTTSTQSTQIVETGAQSASIALFGSVDDVCNDSFGGAPTTFSFTINIPSGSATNYSGFYDINNGADDPFSYARGTSQILDPPNPPGTAAFTHNYRLVSLTDNFGCPVVGVSATPLPIVQYTRSIVTINSATPSVVLLSAGVTSIALSGSITGTSSSVAWTNTGVVPPTTGFSAQTSLNTNYTIAPADYLNAGMTFTLTTPAPGGANPCLGSSTTISVPIQNTPFGNDKCSSIATEPINAFVTGNPANATYTVISRVPAPTTPGTFLSNGNSTTSTRTVSSNSVSESYVWSAEEIASATQITIRLSWVNGGTITDDLILNRQPTITFTSPVQFSRSTSQTSADTLQFSFNPVLATGPITDEVSVAGQGLLFSSVINKWLFFPNALSPGNYPIIATYNKNGCIGRDTITFNVFTGGLLAGGNPIEDRYCVNAAPFEINLSPTTVGVSTLVNIFGPIVRDYNPTTKSAILDPSLAIAAGALDGRAIPIRYSYTDIGIIGFNIIPNPPFGNIIFPILGTITETNIAGSVVIDPLPTLSPGPVPSEICGEDSPFTFARGTGNPLTTFSYSAPGVPSAITTPTANNFVLDPRVAESNLYPIASDFNPKSLTVLYTYTDNQNCSDTTPIEIKIKRQPSKPLFDNPGVLCVNVLPSQEITVLNQSVDDKGTLAPTDDIPAQIVWAQNNLFAGAVNNGTTTFTAPNAFLTDNRISTFFARQELNGCISEYDSVVHERLDYNRNAFNYSTDNFEAGQPTQLSTNLNALGTVVNPTRVIPASLQWILNSGQGVEIANTTIPTPPIGLNTTTFTFPTTDAYRIRSIITTTRGCRDTLEATLLQVERIIVSDNTPAYDQRFGPNNTPGQWASLPGFEWEKVVANKTRIKSPQDTVWITRASGPYPANKEIVIYSPVFDLSGLSRPMITLNTWKHSDINNDGAVLEYSVDGLDPLNPAKVWRAVGFENGGRDWYNSDNLQSTPGSGRYFNALNSLTLGFLGWSGEDSDWKQSSFILDKVVADAVASGNDAIFRIAFGSIGPEEKNDGFAFDDVRIGNRTRTVLLENFRNLGNSAPRERNGNDFVSSFANNNAVGTQLLLINYHVGFPGIDPFNQDYPADPSARALFYNVTQTPSTRLDGDNGGPANADKLFSEWGVQEYGVRTLQLGQAEITFDAVDTNSDDGKISVKLSVEPSVAMDENTTLFLAVVEKQVPLASLGSKQGQVLSNEGGPFLNVLKKLLPDADGRRTGALNAEQVYEFTEEWVPEPSRLYAPSTQDLAIIAFLQNSVTKEIYQAEIFDDLDDPDPTIITGIEPLANDRIQIYPNPADRELTLELPAPAPTSMSLQLIDQLGRVAFSGTLNEGEQKKTISTENAAGGMYFIQIGNGKEAVRKKVLVVHRE